MNWKQVKTFSRTNPYSYLSSFLFVLSAFLATFAIWQFVQPIASPLFLVAIVASAWWGGLRTGVFATILSAFTVDYVFIAPEYQVVGNWDNVLRLAFFLVEGSVISWLIDVRRTAAEKLKESHLQLQELSGHQQTLRETEQKRIALEIHDELGQSLTGMKMYVHWLKRQIKESPEKKIVEQLNDLSGQIDSTISSVRRIATALRPSVLDDFGLIAAIEWQAKEFERINSVHCLIKCRDEDLGLDPESETAVFRIFQETLTNISRHAGASTVHVNIENTNSKIYMCVSDNGTGIELDKIKKSGSLGILGMRERARLIGGEFNIFSGENGGTNVELTIPRRRI